MFALLLYLVGVLYVFLHLADNVQNDPHQLALYATASLGWPLFITVSILQNRSTLLGLIMDLLEIKSEADSTLKAEVNPTVDMIDSL